MITRRNLLKGIAGGLAGSVAASVLIKEHKLGWPFRKGLTIDDLPAPTLCCAVPTYRFGDDSSYFHSRAADQITLVAGGIEMFAV